MKSTILKSILLVTIHILFLAVISAAQPQFLGQWEGFFMNDFKTIIEIGLDENKQLSGNIQMFSGENLIQNDQLSKVTISNKQLSFYIDSKQTDFKGETNDEFKELKGEFIFPDNTRHPITLTKYNPDKNEIKNDSKITYSELKNRKFTIEELKSDFDFMIEKLTEFHPRLYAYISKSEYDKLILKTTESIDSEKTIIDFFKLIAPLTEGIKCSHTGIRLPQNYQEKIYTHENFLPLKLHFEGDKVFCLKDINSSDAITPGSEIVSINKVPVVEIKKMLCSFIPSEGKNTTTKNFYLNQNFNALFNLVDNSKQFEIEYRKRNSNKVTTLKACKYSEIQNYDNRVDNEKPLEFIFDDKKSMGILTLKAFMHPDINMYIREMDAIFETLLDKNAKNLVVDLRGNQGGHPIFAAQLLSYLTHKNFTYFKRNDDIKDFEPLYHQMSPNKLQFDGDLYVFVDGGCLSTTGHLIFLMKHYTNAIFIGEEPGSTFQCNDFSQKVTLPNTGIELNIPRTTFETAIDASEKMTPFTVDYEVDFSIEDYLSGVDSYIKFVKSI